MVTSGAALAFAQIQACAGRDRHDCFRSRAPLGPRYCKATNAVASSGMHGAIAMATEQSRGHRQPRYRIATEGVAGACSARANGGGSFGDKAGASGRPGLTAGHVGWGPDGPRRPGLGSTAVLGSHMFAPLAVGRLRQHQFGNLVKRSSRPLRHCCACRPEPPPTQGRDALLKRIHERQSSAVNLASAAILIGRRRR